MRSWIFHHWYLPVLFMIVTDVVRQFTSHWWIGLSALALGYGMAAVFIAANHWHDNNFCDHCFREPWGDEYKADNHRGALWIYHFIQWASPYVFIIIGVYILGTWILLPSGWVSVWLNILPTYVLIFGVYHATRMHEALVSWCPYCDPDDDGDRAKYPTPDPAGMKRA